MPVQAVQRFICRNFVQRPRVNRGLDRFGYRLNHILESLGIQKRYATGLTRNKAILFVSRNSIEIERIAMALLFSGRRRAERAVENADLAYRVWDSINFSVFEWKNKILFCYENAKQKSIEAAFKTGLTSSQILQLISRVTEKAGGHAQSALEALPAALEAKLSSDQILSLFTRIIEKTGKGVDLEFQELGKALCAVSKYFDSEQIFFLFDEIVEKSREEASRFFRHLPETLETLNKYFSPKQIFSLVDKIAKKSREEASRFFRHLPETLETLNKYFSPEQSPSLLHIIIGVNPGSDFGVFYAAFEAAFKAGLTPSQILQLISRVTEKTGKHAQFALETLPAALEAKLSPDQILSLFTGIIEKTGKGVDTEFHELGAALCAVSKYFIPDQSFYLLGKIIEKARGKAWFAFATLPKALEVSSKYFTSYQILSFLEKIVDSTGSWAGPAFSALPNVLKVKFDPDQIPAILGAIVENAGDQADIALHVFLVLFTNLLFADDSSRNFALSRFLSLLESLTDHNRERVLILLLGNMDLYKNIGSANFLPHYNLYMDILTTRKRLGFALLEGILEATKQGFIPAELTPEEVSKINQFIDQTHSFSPIVYKVYRVEGDSLLQELKPLAERLARDELGKEEIEGVIKKYEKYDGLEFLFAVIQMAIPLSGASFVKREEGKGLLQKMIEAGDLRRQVPPALRGQTRAIALESAEYALRDGEAVDLQAIVPILTGLRGENKAELPELVAAIEAYLRNNTDKESLRQALYRYASRRDLLGEKVDRLGSTDYYTLRLLEEIFRDKDCLQSILARAIDEIDQGLLAAEKIPLTHPEGLLKAVRKMWQGSGSREEKIKRLAAMTTRHSAADLREKVLGKLNEDTDQELKATLADFLEHENQAYISKHKLAEEILREPLTVIQKEKAKFGLMPTAEGINLTLRMVKGIPYSLWGLNAGVCLASDIELWKDPNFKLIAMIDEESQTAAGFIHVYETVIKGRKYWTLPGIEPSTEFIGTVNPAELYDKLIEQMIAFAKDAGIAGIYLPTNPNIHSNRSDIQKIIKEKNYPTKTIPIVHWVKIQDPQTGKEMYPFEEVYVVWGV